MPPIRRRQFLQFAGATAASIGLNQFNLMRQGDRYGRVLAQDTPRKLALFVGINDYSRQFNWSPLNGCVNDVRMQHELLVHRFGFKPADIVTLTNEQATHDGILTAFQEHLIAQAKPGDVVVFHYSGHGSRVVDPAPYREENPLNSTLVPIDSPLPDNYLEAGGNVNDIMGKTLFLLMRQLQTEQVTLVLDSCYSGGGKRGAVTYRARDGASSPVSLLYPSAVEIAAQDALMQALDLSAEQLYDLRQKGVAKGVVISSAAEGQLAADAYFRGFYAGAFTYLLTQYLWQQTGDRTLSQSFIDIDRATQSLASTRTNVQNPEFETNFPPDLADAPLYFTSKQAPPAEAIVTRKQGDRVQIWLGGIHPDSLNAFQAGAVFTAIKPDGQALGMVQLLTAPNGLEGEGTLLETPIPSPDSTLFLQEQVRTVPTDLGLQIGIDGSLEDEQGDAQRAIATLDRMHPQLPGTDTVDYWLGRFRSGDIRFLTLPLEDRPPTDSIALFAPDLTPIPDSWGEPGESAIAAVERLQAKFRSLLAIRLIRSIVNPESSDLRVDAAIQVAGTTESARASNLTVRGGTRSLETDPSEQSLSPSTNPPMDASRLPLDTLIQITVANQETRPVNEANGLYIAVLAIDSSGSMSILYPTQWSDPDLAAFVESGQTLQIPDPERGDRFQLRISPPLGMTEILVIASAVPLRRTLTALSAIATIQEQERGTGSTRGVPLSPPEGDAFVEVANNLLDDMDSGTRGVSAEYAELPAYVRGIDRRQLTALSIPFHVYDPN